MSEGNQGMRLYWQPSRRRLVFVGQAATPEFWRDRWENSDWKKTITRDRHARYWRGRFARFAKPGQTRFLEGGCGDGHLVDALKYWGYDVVGVDYSRETIEAIRKAAPELDVRFGDVRKLEFEDDSFDAYLSGGLIEHFWDGFDDIVSEMYRVLRPGGHAFVTFPHVSRLDRAKILLGRYEHLETEEEPQGFYQSGLDVDWTRREFERHGFRCVYTRSRSGLEGMTRSLAWTRGIRNRLDVWGKKSRFVYMGLACMTRVLAPICGHGVFMVLRK